jgi:hypothetical protein
MPNYDGTGPDGKGPMTGFGRGYCVIPISSSEQELKLLKNQEHVLKAQLNQIRNRIKGLKNEKGVHNARI